MIYFNIVNDYEDLLKNDFKNYRESARRIVKKVTQRS